MDFSKPSKRIMFNGNHKYWDMLKAKYLSRINLCDFRDVILGNATVVTYGQKNMTKEKETNWRGNPYIRTRIIAIDNSNG